MNEVEKSRLIVAVLCVIAMAISLQTAAITSGNRLWYLIPAGLFAFAALVNLYRFCKE